MNQLLQRLREATQTSHEALHVHPLLTTLQDEHITLDDYRWCIGAFHAAYTSIPAVEFAALPPDIPAVAWLQEDMRVHGIKPLTMTFPAYPAIDGLSRYIGYLYVKQGSTLGGQVISKHLQRSLGLVPHQTNHFFAGFGPETGERWKKFIRVMDDSDLDADQVLQQAAATFKHIKRCCNEALRLKRERS